MSDALPPWKEMYLLRLQIEKLEKEKKKNWSTFGDIENVGVSPQHDQTSFGSS